VSADPSDLSLLVEEIGRFHIRDRAMLRAQRDMTRTIASAAGPDAATVARYLDAVDHYFAGFEREARSHLGDIDQRLAKAAQLQFNLTAERGVTAKRIEITQGVLTRARELARR
jgi:hypothetical protein